MKATQKQDMPYEKFLEYGAESLTESELLAIILRTGTKDLSAKELASEVLKLGNPSESGILSLHHLSVKDLMSVKGIGEVKAIKLKCIAELSVRMSRASAREKLLFQTPSTVADYFMELLRHKMTECVYLLCLDSKGRMLHEEKLSDGSVKMSLISPREVFLTALRWQAVNIILVHNHPSGDPTPSESDIMLTENVKTVGEMIDILLLDHIVIGDNRYVSFKEAMYI